MFSSQDAAGMEAAIETAIQGQTPFGCVIVDGHGTPLVAAANTTRKDRDLTAHAECNAIRLLGIPVKDSARDYTLFTTGEPCPMCAGAIGFAGIGRIVYGLGIEDIALFMKQIRIGCRELASQFPAPAIVKGPFMRERCLNLFKEMVLS